VANTLAAKTTPSLLALMGSIDWLTTIIGIAYFGAVESNPFIATLASTNLVAFTVLKLGTAFLVAFLFYQAERTMREAQDDRNGNFKGRFYVLRGLQAASLIALLYAVLNNLAVILL
jgi:hypothetical protein